MVMMAWFSDRPRVVSLALTLVLLAAALVVEAPRAQVASAASTKTVRLAYYYVPPTDGTSLSTLAGAVDHLNTPKGDFLGDLEARGYGGRGLQYQIVLEAGGPGPYANSSASCDSTYQTLGNQVADQKGDFCKYIHPNESWFLHNSKGQRLYAKWGGRIYYHMNPAASGWRSFVLSRLQNRGVKLGFDGLHFENIELSLVKARYQLANADGTVKEYGSDDTFRAAVAAFLKAMSDSLRPSNQIWANLINDRITGAYWDAYMPYLDGMMTEMFATGYSGLSATSWNNQLKQVESVVRSGKGAVLNSQGTKTDTTKETFALGSYLLVTDSNKVSFRYSQSASYSQWWSYANYDVQLGAAKGARYLSGSVWKRDFACGSVTVDPAARTAKISQTTCTSTSTSAPSVSLKGVSDGQTVADTIKVEAAVSSSTSISKVVFSLDGTTVGTESISPYFLGGDNNGTPKGYDTHAWSNGQHVLKAVATDSSGHTGSAQVTITVKNFVALSGISDGQTVSGTIKVKADIVVSTSVVNVVFYIDGKAVSTESIAPYYLGGDTNGVPKGYDTRQLADGQHVLAAVGTDTSGLVSTAWLMFNVNN